MTTFKLQSYPNIEFAKTVEGVTYYFHFCYFRGLMYATIEDATGAALAQSLRCVDRQWLIPYPAYVKEGKGNFRFEDMNGDYPDFRNFGTTCNLVYYTATEIADMEQEGADGE